MNPELRPISSILRLLAIFMAATLLICACSRPPRHQKAFDRARAVMDSLPEQALLILDSIPTAELDPGLDSARYILLHALAEDKAHVLETSDSTLKAIIPIFERERQNVDLRTANYMVGISLDCQEEYAEAITYLMEAEKGIDANTSDFEKGLIYTELSECCNATLNGELALKYINLAYNSFKKASKPAHSAYALYDKATYLNNNTQFQEAKKLFHHITLLADSINDKNLQYAATAGMAYSCMGQGLYKEAVAYFHRIPKGAQAIDNQALALMAEAELQYGNRVAADSLSNILLSRGDYRWIYAINPDNITVAQIIDAYKQNDDSNGELYLDAYQDRFPTILEENFTLKDELSKSKIRLQRYSIIALIATIILLGLASYLLINRYKTKIREEKESNLYLSNDFTSFLGEYNNKMQQISNAAKSTKSHLTKYFHMLHELADSYFTDSKGSKVFQKKSAILIEQLLEELRNDPDTLIELENMINLCHDNIITRFKDEYTDLSDAEKTLFIYISSGLSSFTLSKIYKLETPHQISVRKYRLKKKIENLSTPSQADFLKYF